MEVGKIFFEIMILIKKVLYFLLTLSTNFQKSDARSFEKNVEIFF